MLDRRLCEPPPVSLLDACKVQRLAISSLVCCSFPKQMHREAFTLEVRSSYLEIATSDFSPPRQGGFVSCQIFSHDTQV